MVYNTIYWDTSNFTDEEQVQIHRSVTGELGSYALIDTIDLGSPDWSGSYVDTTGVIDSWYIIRTYDGTSYSGSSQPIGPIETKLSTVEDVKRVARYTGNQDVSDYEIVASIKDSDDYIFEEYGDPIRKTYFNFNHSTGSTIYDFTGDRKSVWRVDEVRVDGDPIPIGSYTIGYRQGFIKFDLTFIQSWDATAVEVDWVPQIYHLLSQDMATLHLLEDSMVIDGDEVISTLARRIRDRVGSHQESIRPNDVIGTTNFEHYDTREAEYVSQWDHYD